MAAPLCQTCERPDPTGGHVCTQCARVTRRHLRDIAVITPAARAVAAGQARHGQAVGGTGAIRLQLNLTAAARLDAVVNELTTWVRHIAGERGVHTPAGGDPVITCADWLGEHVEWLRHRPEAIEAFGDFAAVRRLLESLANGPGERRWLGQCGADTADGRCPADLYARPDAPHATCRACGIRHDTAQRRAWLDDVARDYAYTATEIEAAYPQIKAGTIRVWAHRGLLAPSGHDRDGRPLYSLGAVLDLAASETKRRAEARARRARRAAERAA